ncbi:glycine-rich domain-containing protein [Streptomyces sp. 150FB]|uniref:glycine-rich domain-containing protein n=1 Tax=Streptomyces sp. 150FB TaxID=1576605 RepID=UPI0012377769|nr:hypothetical protein [Streptomyces sp. 150FB]
MGARIPRAMVGVLVMAGGVVVAPLGAAGPAQAALPACAKVFTVTTAKRVECVQPAGTKRVRVSLLGAGGGGGGVSIMPFTLDEVAGGGGGGGALIECTYTPTTETLYFTLSVGAGGAPGAVNKAGSKGRPTFSRLGGNADADSGSGGGKATGTIDKPQIGKGGPGGSGTHPKTSCYDSNTGTRTPGRPGTSNSNGGAGGAAAHPLPAGCPANAGQGGKGGRSLSASGAATPGRPGCARVEFLTATN